MHNDQHYSCSCREDNFVAGVKFDREMNVPLVLDISIFHKGHYVNGAVIPIEYCPFCGQSGKDEKLE